MSFQRLSDISNDLIQAVASYAYVRRDLLVALNPPPKQVTILKGARGIGKSTLIQQFLLIKRDEGSKVLYVSADSTLLNIKLAEFAHEYYKRGGEYLAVDEIHKYAGWQSEIKTILDAFPSMKLIVSGSSSLSLDYASADLSRRHLMLHAKGLSFREYVNKGFKLDLSRYTLPEILASTSDIVSLIVKKFRESKLDLLEIFKIYLRSGYFLSRENYSTQDLYYDSLLNTINSVIDTDISSVHSDIDVVSKQKMKQLLKHIASKCPFTPNLSELSKSLSIANDNALKKYLYYLSEGEILTNLYCMNKSHKDFQKPQKILLNNTNFSFAFNTEPLVGTVRETFVANCLHTEGELTAPTHGDFCLNGDLVFEVGGRTKNRRQIKSIKNSYVLADDVLSVDFDNIPLWLLGFLW